VAASLNKQKHEMDFFDVTKTIPEENSIKETILRSCPQHEPNLLSFRAVEYRRGFEARSHRNLLSRYIIVDVSKWEYERDYYNTREVVFLVGSAGDR
jgi:hypothetical protein